MTDYGYGTGTPAEGEVPVPSDATIASPVDLPITLVSLNQFAQILGLDPLHFWGGYSDLRPSSATCHDVWMEYQWQAAGKAARTDVVRELARAEEDIARHIGYWPAWKWIEDERHQMPREWKWPNLNYNRLSTNWGYMISGGIQTTAEIAATSVTRGADIDADGDGFAELAAFTLTGISADWELEELRACFKEYSVADVENSRLDPSSGGYDERWEIRPIRMARDGTTVRAYVPVWQLFRPQLIHAHDADQIDADDADSYVDTITFYRVYTDYETQAQFLWGVDCVYNVSCAWASQDGCIRTVSPRTGVITVTPGTWDDDSETFASVNFSYATVPNVVRLWYKAGLPWAAPRVVQSNWAHMIVRLACSRLAYPVCTCSAARQMVGEWRENAAKMTEERTFRLNWDVLSNPFGTRFGEVLTWQALHTPGLKRGRAVRT